LLAAPEGTQGSKMKIQVIVHEAEEGGYWAEVPAIPGCASQGDTLDELMQNIREAIEGCLSIAIEKIPTAPRDRVMELAV
jgi:predicted RNase H-like HicB family nuclease